MDRKVTIHLTRIEWISNNDKSDQKLWSHQNIKWFVFSWIKCTNHFDYDSMNIVMIYDIWMWLRYDWTLFVLGWCFIFFCETWDAFVCELIECTRFFVHFSWTTGCFHRIDLIERVRPTPTIDKSETNVKRLSSPLSNMKIKTKFKVKKNSVWGPSSQWNSINQFEKL